MPANETTPHLGISLIYSNQSQKEVTANEAFLALDRLLNTGAISQVVATPPSTPDEGDLYIIAASATDDWEGHEAEITCYHASKGWVFITPNEGMTLWVSDEDTLYTYNGSAWAVTASGETMDKLGINTTADATNKLAVKSSAVLFDNVGAGAQVKVNKYAAGDTASHLFQTNYSGRAEFGLTGDDNFHVKVSPNGSTWYDALTVDKSTGALTPGQPALARVNFNILRGIVLPQTQTLIEAFTTAPKRKRTFLIDDLISSLIDAGVWAKIDLLYLMAGADSQAAGLNWKSPSTGMITATNSPTFTADRGYTGNGTSSYLATGIAFNSLSFFTQNSAHLGAWTLNNVQSAQGAIGNDASNNIRLNPRGTTDLFSSILNDSSSKTTANNDSRGHFITNRSGSTSSDIQLYKNASAQTTSGGGTSSTVSSGNVCILRSNTTYASYQIAAAHVGGSLNSTEATAVYTALQTYLQGVGAV